MPTYEYKCLSCGHRFEVFQKMTDEPIKTCPECGGEVKKLIGAGAGLIFKGSGFYITDYKNNSSSSSKPKTNGNKTEKPTKNDTATNNKSAAQKNETKTITKKGSE